MWLKCIFLVIKYIRFEDLLDYVHFVTKQLFYRHFAWVQQESLFQVFVNQALLFVFSARLLLKGKVSYDEVRMWSCPVSLQVNWTGVFWVHLRRLFNSAGCGILPAFGGSPPFSGAKVPQPVLLNNEGAARASVVVAGELDRGVFGSPAGGEKYYC